MKTRLVAALLIASAAPAFAQQPRGPLPPVDPKVAELRDSALKDDLAYDIVEGLTTEVGQRLAGTEAEARARDWAVRKLKALGFANVRVDTFDIPVWTRGAETVEVLAPFPQKLVVAALGNSASTGPQGITGEVIGFDTLSDLEAAPDEQ
ncbi:MAG TPA: peptidase M28 family protein, partial [Sphingomicrobium sp.]|nr:peptidase M28 family protein [Sphingomicrobium sp.]